MISASSVSMLMLRGAVHGYQDIVAQDLKA